MIRYRSNIISTSSKTKKEIWVFAFASFLNDLGSDMIYPIWPLFVTSVLGANMAVLGFLDGLGEMLVSISQVFSGYISDKIGNRKVFVWTGYVFGSLSRVGYAVSTVWQHLVPFRILDRAGKIRSAPRDAIVADLSTKQCRGRNFGLIRALDNLGAVCGILICILFIELLGYRTLFFIAAIPSVIAALLIFILIKEKNAKRAKIFKRPFIKGLGANYKIFLLLSSLFALGSFSYSFLLIYAKEFGFRIGFVPILYLIFTAVASVFSLPFGRLSDKIGRKSVMIMSFLLWASVCLCFIYLQNYPAIILSFVLYGMHKAALEPVQRTFVSELVVAEYRASGMGGLQMVTGLCALPASLIAGILWTKVNMYAPFYFSLSLTALSAIILMFVDEK